MFIQRDETGNSDESKKQETGLVHQEFLSFIECIVVVGSLSVSKEQEKKYSKDSQTSVNTRMPPSILKFCCTSFFLDTIKRQT